jgi:hypothetical protein
MTKPDATAELEEQVFGTLRRLDRSTLWHCDGHFANSPLVGTSVLTHSATLISCSER